MPKSSFLKFIHIYRGFAILMIVAGHVFASMLWEDQSDIAEKIDIVFFDNVSVIFMFISGFLFQHLIKKYEFSRYIKTKFKFVVLPYLILSIPVIVIRIIIAKPTSFLLTQYPEFSSLHPLFQAGFYLVTGAHLRPFWFIPMIIIFYFTSPLFKALDRHHKFYPPVLLLLFILSFVIPRPVSTNVLFNYLHFLSVYVMGMYVSRNKKAVFDFLDRYIVVAVFIMTILIAICLDYPSTHFSFLQKFYASVFFFYLFWKLEGLFNRRMSKVADYSFGIFFLHDYIDLFYKVVLEKLTGNAFLNGSYILFLIMFIAIVALCVLIIKIIKHFTGKNSRLIIGS